MTRKDNPPAHPAANNCVRPLLLLYEGSQPRHTR